MNYSADYNLLGQNLLPPSKRLPVFNAWVSILSGSVQYQHDLIFNDYYKGTSAGLYDNTTTYNRGDRVKYNHMVFDAKQTTVGNAPLGLDTDNDPYWVKVLNNDLGALDRVKWNGQRLVMEYVLNKYFSTTFRQPQFTITNPPGYYPPGTQGPYGTDLRSDFYVDTLKTDSDVMLVGKQDNEQIGMYAKRANTPYPNYGVGPSYDPTKKLVQISYPLSVIPTTTDNKFYQLKALVNRIKLCAIRDEDILYYGY